MSRPQQFAQKQRMGRGWAITRNSATLATTDYEHIANEIVTALNEQERLKDALRVIAAGGRRETGQVTASADTLRYEASRALKGAS